MEKLSYKTFVWPQNPHTYQEKTVREAEYEKDDAGEDVFQGLGSLKRTITGSGVFFGDSAFESFRTLAALMDQTTPGNLQHPVWGIRYCYLTGLELTQEPRDNYVSYKFEFQQAESNGDLPK